MSKFTSYREESRKNYGVNYKTNLTEEQLQVGAQLRVADELEAITRWGRTANFCSAARALPRIANALEKGITIRHEHALALKLSWSIRWPWQQRGRRRQRRFRLFRRRKAPA